MAKKITFTFGMFQSHTLKEKSIYMRDIYTSNRLFDLKKDVQKSS